MFGGCHTELQKNQHESMRQNSRQMILSNLTNSFRFICTQHTQEAVNAPVDADQERLRELRKLATLRVPAQLVSLAFQTIETSRIAEHFVAEEIVQRHGALRGNSREIKT